MGGVFSVFDDSIYTGYKDETDKDMGVLSVRSSGTGIGRVYVDGSIGKFSVEKSSGKLFFGAGNAGVGKNLEGSCRYRRWSVLSDQRADAEFRGESVCAVRRNLAVRDLRYGNLCVEMDQRGGKIRKKNTAFSAVCSNTGDLSYRDPDILMRGRKEMERKRQILKKRAVKASYTVEAAGVMAIVFFVMMILLNQAFHVHAETAGSFAVHEEAERERHKTENEDEGEITRETQGMRWSLDLTVPVYRPEDSLRIWSLAD